MTKVWSQFQWYQFPIHYSRPDLNKLKFSRSAPVWSIPKLQIRLWIKVISKLKFWLVDIEDPLWICEFKTLFFLRFALFKRTFLPWKQVFWLFFLSFQSKVSKFTALLPAMKGSYWCFLIKKPKHFWKAPESLSRALPRSKPFKDSRRHLHLVHQVTPKITSKVT